MIAALDWIHLRQEPTYTWLCPNAIKNAEVSTVALKSRQGQTFRVPCPYFRNCRQIGKGSDDAKPGWHLHAGVKRWRSVEQAVGPDRKVADGEKKCEHYQEARWRRGTRSKDSKANPETWEDWKSMIGMMAKKRKPIDDPDPVCPVVENERARKKKKVFRFHPTSRPFASCFTVCTKTLSINEKTEPPVRKTGLAVRSSTLLLVQLDDPHHNSRGLHGDLEQSQIEIDPA